jgi:nucleoid-associated protein YgaU
MAVKDITTGASSRLAFHDLLLVGGTVFFDFAELPEIPIQDGDIRYQVQSNDRIDRLALQFYGDAVLWWVIAVANRLDLLPCDLHPGDFLRIPSPLYVSQRLFANTGVA